MNSPDLTALKKLIKLCRESGVKSYKCSEFEFTLTDEVPTKRKYTRKARLDLDVNSPDHVPTDGLSDEELLMWSVTANPQNPEEIQ